MGVPIPVVSTRPSAAVGVSAVMRGSRAHVVYSLYKRYRSKILTWQVAGRHHEAPIDPFELLFVDPGSIRFVQENSSDVREYPYSVSEVRAGDWDEQVTLFREHDFYRSFDAHFNDDVAWIETEWAQRVISEIEEGIRVYGCETTGEFLQRCSEIDELYGRIAREGYKTQKELLDGGSTDSLGRWWAYYCPNLHEITVNIGRYGEIIFEDGWRRFAIADLLEVEEIPVRINIRHYRWQQYRDILAVHDDIEPCCQHPDLIFS